MKTNTVPETKNNMPVLEQEILFSETEVKTTHSGFPGEVSVSPHKLENICGESSMVASL